MALPTVHSSLTPDFVRTLLQEAGYRVESLAKDGTPGLHSSTAGVAFDIRFANPATEPGAFGDMIFQAAFRIEGDLPLSLVNRWNKGRRFARLYSVEKLLLLDMDVLALGGVTRDHLRAAVEIWDHLQQQLVAYLRDELPRLEAEVVPAKQSA